MCNVSEGELPESRKQEVRILNYKHFCPCSKPIISELVQQYGIGIRILGDVSLLSKDVQEVVHRAVELTKKNNRAILNLCFPYTSRDELTMATRSLVSGIEAQDLDPRYPISTSFTLILNHAHCFAPPPTHA